MNDGVDAVERLLHGGGVADVAFDEDGATARDRLDSVENGAVGVGEIVEEHDVMAGSMSTTAVWEPMKPMPPVSRMFMSGSCEVKTGGAGAPSPEVVAL